MSNDLDDKLQASDDCQKGIVNGLSIFRFFEKLDDCYEPPGVRFQRKFPPFIILSQEAVDALLDYLWKRRKRRIYDYRESVKSPMKEQGVKEGFLFGIPFFVEEDTADD